MDYDSPWKEFITVFFRQLIQLILPDLYAMIDWRRKPQFVDTELRRLSPQSETGRLHPDRLARVWLKNGEERGVHIHVEAQSQFTAKMEERVFTYYARGWLELRTDIICIVIYADKNPNWRPNRYVRELPGTRLDFQFHAVKLLDLDEAFLTEQAKHRNPAALMLLAFRRAMQTEGNVDARFEARKQLIALMMEYGYTPDQQAQILRLLEWVLMLPETLEQQVEEFVEQYKRERGTPFVSRLEKRAIAEGLAKGRAEGLAKGRAEGLAKGRAEGRAEGEAKGRTEGQIEALRGAVLRALNRRFGNAAETARPLVESVSKLQTLEALFDAALDAPSLEAFQTQ
ncbi:MAG: hypothetical protein NZM28_06750, partial [Fimbriimonadales bacterium]|nr:hypothetical protein [Fimbriimonadales bacterium]